MSKTVSWEKDPKVLLEPTLVPSDSMTQVQRDNSHVRVALAISILLMVGFRSWKPLGLFLLVMLAKLALRPKCKLVIVSPEVGCADAIDLEESELPELLDQLFADVRNAQAAKKHDCPKTPQNTTGPKEPEPHNEMQSEPENENSTSSEATAPYVGMNLPMGYEADEIPNLRPRVARPLSSSTQARLTSGRQPARPGKDGGRNGRAVQFDQVLLNDQNVQYNIDKEAPPVRRGFPKQKRHMMANRSRKPGPPANQKRKVVEERCKPTEDHVSQIKLTPRISKLDKYLLKMKDPEKARVDYSKAPGEMADREAFVKFLQQPTIFQE